MKTDNAFDESFKNKKCLYCENLIYFFQNTCTVCNNIEDNTLQKIKTTNFYKQYIKTELFILKNIKNLKN